MRKRDAQDGGEDTVEKAVEGLAESILREDAEKRKEELVSFGLVDLHSRCQLYRTFSTFSQKGRIGI
jgi:coiled-coil domain-containing protein 12